MKTMIELDTTDEEYDTYTHAVQYRVFHDIVLEAIRNFLKYREEELDKLSSYEVLEKLRAELNEECCSLHLPIE